VLTAGCASTKKVDVLERQNTEQKKALEEADVRVLELERQIAELEAVSEEQKASSEQEIAVVKETYENLVKDLKKEVESGKIEIDRDAGGLTLHVAEELFFDTGKANIKPDGKKLLLRIGKVLNKVPDKNIRVEGHTDNVPIGPSLKKRYPTNWELAAARAVNVVRFLQQEAKVDPRRLSAVAYAQYRPVASNKTEAGRKKNRRVDIILVDKELDTAKKTKSPL
jgi:chemotaxis protein MotB